MTKTIEKQAVRKTRKKNLKPSIKLEQAVRKQIYEAIQGPAVESLIQKLGGSSSDKYWRSVMEGQSFKVEEKLMSNLYHLFNDVKNDLGFEGPIDFYVTGDSDVNAFSVASEKEGEPNIVNINSALVELMTEDELRFVVGHEIGHLINKDTNFRRLLSFIFPDITKTPVILQYKVHLEDNLCELVADRYGYIAMPDINVCVSSFFKMSSGLDVAKLDVDMDTFIAENRKRLEYFISGEGISTSDHPVNPIRVEALHLFATCTKQKELDEKMNELINILLKVGTSEVDQYVPYFIAATGLIVASVDKEVCQEEYEAILSSLSTYKMFPKDFLDEVNGQDVAKVFNDSVAKILSIEPGLRDNLFTYVLTIVFADQKFTDDEMSLVYDLGSKVFGYSEKEIAGMFAALIQLNFTPDLEALC